MYLMLVQTNYSPGMPGGMGKVARARARSNKFVIPLAGL